MFHSSPISSLLRFLFSQEPLSGFLVSDCLVFVIGTQVSELA